LPGVCIQYLVAHDRVDFRWEYLWFGYFAVVLPEWRDTRGRLVAFRTAERQVWQANPAEHWMLLLDDHASGEHCGSARRRAAMKKRSSWK
jgi:hypothetical protein